MKIRTKLSGGIAAASMLAISNVLPVSAHVVVRPAEVATGAYQTFTVSAPNEKNQAFVSIKLLIPSSIRSVTPTSKPGWTITMDKTGEGEAAKVTAITWAGGTVDAGLRDEFTFSAKTPDTTGDIEWKAYQTYADGTTVSWDQKEENHSDSDSDDPTSGPLSVTKVSTEATADTADSVRTDELRDTKRTAQFALYTALAALVAILVVLGYIVKNK